MNKHNDHIASCLCCSFCRLDYEEDLSDVTPGRGMFYECLKHIWDAQADDTDLHDKISIGIECPEFLEIGWRLAKSKQSGEKCLARIVLRDVVGDMIEFREPHYITTIPVFESLWEWDDDSVLAEWYERPEHSQEAP